MKSVVEISTLFEGRKSKWLPLYHRLLARMSNVTGVELFPIKNAIAIGRTRETKASMGVIRITARGLDIGLGLARAFGKTDRLRPSQRSPKWITHRVVIAKASDIDEEFLTWLKAARMQARTARPRST